MDFLAMMRASCDNWQQAVGGDIYGAHAPAPAPAPSIVPRETVKRPYLEWDTECARNWWLLKLLLPDNSMLSFHLFDNKPAFTDLEIAQIKWAMDNFTWVGFNSMGYDEPMLKLALCGVGCTALKELNDHIITGGAKWWTLRDSHPLTNYKLENFDHIDIMEVAPGVRIGLKTYMARMHAPTIQDLPFDPQQVMTAADIEIADKYCGNDLAGTRMLREAISKRLQLRERLSDQLGVDLRSKSDAQMSEAIIIAKLGYKPQKQYLPTGFQFQLKVAPWLQFVTPQMREVFETCKAVWFFWSLKEDGEPLEFPDGEKIKTGVNMPKEIASIRVAIGRSVYKFGIGGLHSTESAQVVQTVVGVNELSDHDVAGFYPKTAMLMQLFNSEIMPIYSDIYDTRVGNKRKIKAAAKKVAEAKIWAAEATDFSPAEAAEVVRKLESELGDIETITDGYKIVLNGGYGKLWSKYSFLLDPVAGIAITLNGQLSLLMLIERLELGGVSVVSANTDGIVLSTPHHLRNYRDMVLKWWETTCGYELEATPYTAVFSRDVNNYVAIKPDGEIKRKGAFSKSGVLASMQGIHPDQDICREAAVAYLAHGTPIEETIRACTDIRMFIRCRSVKGGGQWRGGFLGKTVRFYLSTNGEPITYLSNGHKVSGSDGAYPVQVLPPSCPADIDYPAYVDATIKLLQSTGAIPKPPPAPAVRKSRKQPA